MLWIQLTIQIYGEFEIVLKHKINRSPPDVLM